jgi:hypothetical protein
MAINFNALESASRASAHSMTIEQRWEQLRMLIRMGRQMALDAPDRSALARVRERHELDWQKANARLLKNAGF